ncbi:MAG: hypothetical protein WDO13_20245 [Verrucomicrobiota bacterium]
MSFVHRVLQRIMGFVARLVCARPGVIVAVGVSLAVAGAVVTALKWEPA